MSKLSIIEALQKTIQAIKQWLPLTPGKGTSSIVQDGNQAFAANSTALGYKTIAGSKGYRISAFVADGERIDKNTYSTGTYALVLNQGETIPTDIVNSVLYSMYLKQTKDNIGKITSIDGNIITVQPFFYPEKWDEGQWEELDENGNKTGNTLTGEAWEKEKAKAFASSYIIFEGLPTVGNINVGVGAHAEGWGNIATQEGSHAEGSESKALGKYSHAEGDSTVAYYSAHSEGKLAKAIGYHSHAEGYRTQAQGMDSHSEGRDTIAIGQDSHAEGKTTIAEGINSHAEGVQTLAKGQHSHAEGSSSQATGLRSHAEGLSTIASGANSHAEGSSTKASADNAHAEGSNTNASGGNAHAEGRETAASGTNAHAEGQQTKAIGNNSHAAGQGSTAYGLYSYAGGMNSTTGILNDDGTVVTNSGAYAFSHGYQTAAKGRGSVALGRDTIATDEFQTVIGSFNDPTVKNARFVVGTGDKANNLKNGFIVYKDGRAAVLADPINDMDLATKQYVDNNTPEEFIAFIDINADTTQEEIQAALDAVYGTAILSIKQGAQPYFWLTLSKNVKELYFENEDWGGMIDITGPGKYSDTVVFADYAGLTELFISNVRAVYYSNPMFGSYTNCETVIGCSGDTYINCDYLYDINLYADHPDTRYYKLEYVHKISNVRIGVSSTGDSIIFNDCDEIDGVSIEVYSLEDWGETHTCTFSNCNSIRNVSIANSENITDKDIKVTYNNCNFIDPLTVYKAPNHIELNEELSELALQLFPEVHNSGNWVGGDNWYTIATTAKSVYMTPAIFRILARSQPKGGAWTSAYVIVNSCFDLEPDIVVLTCQQKYSQAKPLIDKVRVITPKSFNGLRAYLQVHVTAPFAGFGENGVPQTENQNGAEIIVDIFEGELDNRLSWQNKWKPTIELTPFEFDSNKYYATEKELLAERLSNTAGGSNKLYLHSISFRHDYDWDNPDNEDFRAASGYVKVYRTTDARITSLAELKPGEIETAKIIGLSIHAAGNPLTPNQEVLLRGNSIDIGCYTALMDWPDSGGIINQWNYVEFTLSEFEVTDTVTEV